MADKHISELTEAASIGTSDLFVVEQASTAKKVTGQTLMRDLATALDGHGGISNISYSSPVSPSLSGTMTISLADGTQYYLSVTNGRGITGINWTASGTAGNGQTHTGTISYNDGTTSTVTFKDGVKGNTGAQTYVWIKWSQNYPTQNSDMQNSVGPYIGIYSGTSSTAPTSYTSYSWYEYKGDKGDTGDSIESISKTSTSGLNDTYTIYMTGGVAAGTFTVTNAKSISSVALQSGNHAAGTTDTYRITFNNGDTFDFSVYNGANGLGSVSSVSGIQADGNGDVAQVLSGSQAPTINTIGQENQLYFDSSSHSLYYCAGETGGTYNWFVASSQVTVDSALSTSSTNPVQNKIITGKVGTTSLNTTATNLSDAINEVLTSIPSASTTTPSKDGTGAAGNGTTWARSNHVHPLNVPSSGVPANLGTASNGSASTYARSDHVHKLPDYVYVGTSAPSDGNINIWLDTDEPGQSAVSSVNGANGTVVLGADDVGAMSKLTLLWTNASPTSSFDAQTVPLTLTGYAAVIVEFKGDYQSETDGNRAKAYSVAFVDSDIAYGGILPETRSSRLSLRYRMTTATSSGVTFQTGSYNASAVAAGTSTQIAIPLRIWGIKGVN